jgi:hypothetical protein
VHVSLVIRRADPGCSNRTRVLVSIKRHPPTVAEQSLFKIGDPCQLCDIIKSTIVSSRIMALTMPPCGLNHIDRRQKRLSS